MKKETFDLLAEVFKKVPGLWHLQEDTRRLLQSNFFQLSETEASSVENQAKIILETEKGNEAKRAACLLLGDTLVAIIKRHKSEGKNPEIIKSYQLGSLLLETLEN